MNQPPGRVVMNFKHDAEEVPASLQTSTHSSADYFLCGVRLQNIKKFSEA
jgi:hypothetical protein